jgi:hypothetical protein
MKKIYINTIYVYNWIQGIYWEYIGDSGDILGFRGYIGIQGIYLTPTNYIVYFF